jgi:hypothetical protein
VLHEDVVASLEDVVAVGRAVASPLEAEGVVTSLQAKEQVPPCQLCGRTNHPVFKCYKRFDLRYMGEEKSANAAGSYGVDSN